MVFGGKAKRERSVYDAAIFFIQERTGSEYDGCEKIVGKRWDIITGIWEGNVQVCVGKEGKLLGSLLQILFGGL